MSVEVELPQGPATTNPCLDKVAETDTTDLKHDAGASSDSVSEPVKEKSEVESADKENEDANSGDLCKKIRRQVEYYFGDYNMARDKFIQGLVAEDDGWVCLTTMLKFQRLKKLSEDIAAIGDALKHSNLVQVSEDGSKIRRDPDLAIPQANDEVARAAMIARSVYVKGFDKFKTSLDDLLTFFDGFDGVVNVHMRRFPMKNAPKSSESGINNFKGSVFVTFKNVELAEKFIQLETLSYKGVSLIRKWQSDYMQEKTEEYKARQAERERKAQDKEKAVENSAKQMKIDLPLGAILTLSVLSDAKYTREAMKSTLVDKFQMDGSKVAFIDFQTGRNEAKIRFSEANYAVEFAKRIGSKIELNDDMKEVEVGYLQDEAETVYLKECLTNMMAAKSRGRSNKRNFPDKRSGGGRQSKRHRS